MSACKVVVDYGKCAGLGMCEAVDPDVFEIDEDGSLLVHGDTFDETRRALLEEAAASCPTQAIEIRIAAHHE
ncbi:ferredoxin [Gordonia lacunae]|uniref:ferredoxin n=1 Tax=Gordonia lacunae TaxID=417102 RepID=UPI0039E36A48